MSYYILLEDGNKIYIEDQSGYLKLEQGFTTPRNLMTVAAESRTASAIASESRYPKVEEENRSGKPGD